MVMRTPDEAVSMTVAVTGSREEDEAEVEAEVEVSVEEEEEEASGPEGSHQFKLLRGGRTPHGVILTSRRRSRRGGGGRRRGGGGGGRCERLDLERSDLGVDVLVVGRVDHEQHLSPTQRGINFSGKCFFRLWSMNGSKQEQRRRTY